MPFAAARPGRFCPPPFPPFVIFSPKTATLQKASSGPAAKRAQTHIHTAAQANRFTVLP